MLATMYGAGLRVSEVESEGVRPRSRTTRDLGSWRQGPQDRQVMLAEPLRDLLAGVLALETPHRVAFSRQKAGLPHQNH